MVLTIELIFKKKPNAVVKFAQLRATMTTTLNWDKPAYYSSVL
jgi:hypothetical protein